MGAKCKKYPISHLFYPTENENEMLNGKKVEKKLKNSPIWHFPSTSGKALTGSLYRFDRVSRFVY